MTRFFDAALAGTGLNSGQFNILVVISAHTPATASVVATALAMDRTTLSRNLKPLRRAGLIGSGGGAGRRPDLLVLTDAGNARLAEATALWRQAQTQVTKQIGASQAGVLLSLLDSIASTGPL